MPEKYDVVIIGGGPGGATAGLLLARRGISVAIVDRARFPREKPCAGLLSGRSIRILAQMHGQHAVPQLARASSTVCRMFHRGRPLAARTDCEQAYVVDRKDFDHFLLRAANEAGCKVIEERKAVGIETSVSRVTLAGGETIHGDVIIGADGANSLLRRTCWPHSAVGKKADGVGFVADAPVECFKTAEMRDVCTESFCVFFGLMPWGYGWIFPKGPTVSVGVGGLIRRGLDLRDSLTRFVDKYFREGTWQRLRVRAHPLPLGRFERSPGRDNLLLVGDAAGLVEPVTGEGIAFACQSGELAAAAAAETIARGKPSEAGRIYELLMRPTVLHHFHEASVARWLFYSKPCFPLAMHLLRHHPSLVRDYFELLSGRRSYLAYFTHAALRWIGL